MDRNQKLIVLLLVLAIIFSFASVLISMNVAKIELPGRDFSGNAIRADENGGIGLVVEANNPAGVNR